MRLINNQIKIALPKGRLLRETASLLQGAGWELSGYHEGTRSYYLESRRFPNLQVRMFHEKDIPIQVAVGNYDLGICGLDWVEELLAKYPSSNLVKVKNLEYGEGALFMVAGRSGTEPAAKDMLARKEVVRIVGEYPNLAESFALRNRLRRFSVFPLWGAAEVYPPESADLALISGRKEGGFFDHVLVPVSNILNFSAFLIANRSSWETKDMGDILASIGDGLFTDTTPFSPEMMEQYPARPLEKSSLPKAPPETDVRLALPDGHQQSPTIQLLNRAGIQVEDYPSKTGNRRPTSNLAGVVIKVIRPQDMPLQVANGNFDLAITGRDWLTEHLYQFPSSPATELLDLKFGRVRMVAVVHQDLAVADVYNLGQFSAGRSLPLRVASEYVNIADKYVRDNHPGFYKVIPTWGATEAFLPEDADMLIENTETGRTIARHNLKIIDTLFESTACLIGRKDSEFSPAKRERIRSITETLRTAVEES